MATASTKRQQRWRMRQARGVISPHVAVAAVVVEALLELGRLSDEQSRDSRYVAVECSAVLEEWARVALKNL